MATGPEMLEEIQSRIVELPSGNYVGVDVREKLDLCKLNVSDLTNAGYDEKEAEKAVESLNQQELGPLANLLGVKVLAKFKVWCDRREKGAKIRAEGVDNCEWLREYLVSKIDTAKPTDVEAIEDTPVFWFVVQFSAQVTPYRLQKVVTSCPQIVNLMRNLVVNVDEQPHYKIEAYNLASWIEDTAADSWWTSDGDVSLGSTVSFPCPSDELATALRRINRPLLLIDPSESPDADGQEITPNDLARIVGADEWGNRLLRLCWEGQHSPWEIIEEEPSSESLNEL